MTQNYYAAKAKTIDILWQVLYKSSVPSFAVGGKKLSCEHIFYFEIGTTDEAIVGRQTGIFTNFYLFQLGVEMKDSFKIHKKTELN